MLKEYLRPYQIIFPTLHNLFENNSDNYNLIYYSNICICEVLIHYLSEAQIFYGK